MGETPAGRRCIATKNPDLLSCLLPLASCLLPLAFPKRDYVHNSNNNAIAS
ncbi:hypothetical protein [Moorena sp. SIO3B2]|uniref:hypothetical protein n=1 Tax=Moorena sp. SIO3B2 TaxID=2607827 RepID=UPI0013CB2877|nr:hypothetical protein [Moorena sp. SIO3B2]NEP34982.1 hypothetical protein [Moorena sp. SIO3B2]NEP47770.1 hypothetical protein [Moorena sp. SIO3C2]